MLVIARDTAHAEEIMDILKGEDFGDYKDKVLTVHSAKTGEERDETVETLLSVEDPKNLIEIVIHVNMLKEGWDVKNLYTIVPLRAANSLTLVKQSLGRGLRLPYGKRTGVGAIDTLNIVAHDRFDEIVKEAREGKLAILLREVKLERDSDKRKESVKVEPYLETVIGGGASPLSKSVEGGVLFNQAEQSTARMTLEVIEESYRSLPSSTHLEKKREEIIERVRQKQQSRFQLAGFPEEVDTPAVINKVIHAIRENTIDIPRIIIEPEQITPPHFQTFTLDTSQITYKPVKKPIIRENLRTGEREEIERDREISKKKPLKDYIVISMMDFEDICYDEDALVLYNLAGQAVKHLQSYLKEEKDVRRVLHDYQRNLANIIYEQMKTHQVWGEYQHEARVSHGFTKLRGFNYTKDKGQQAHNFRRSVNQPVLIRSMVFEGFEKCLYPYQKFHTNTERKFVVLLEDERDVLKWARPAEGDILIYYTEGKEYVPDFVVETKESKLLCETKATDDISTKEVQDKAQSARAWCKEASVHAKKHKDKAWQYVLIPHTEVLENATLKGLVAKFGRG